MAKHEELKKAIDASRLGPARFGALFGGADRVKSWLSGEVEIPPKHYSRINRIVGTDFVIDAKQSAEIKKAFKSKTKRRGR